MGSVSCGVGRVPSMYWTMGGEARRQGDRLAAGRSLWRNRMRKGYMSVVPFTLSSKGIEKTGIWVLLQLGQKC